MTQILFLILSIGIVGCGSVSVKVVNQTGYDGVHVDLSTSIGTDMQFLAQGGQIERHNISGLVYVNVNGGKKSGGDKLVGWGSPLLLETSPNMFSDKLYTIKLQATEGFTVDAFGNSLSGYVGVIQVER